MRDLLHTCTTDAGIIGITSNGKSLTGIYFPGEELPRMEVGEDEIIIETVTQLTEYLSGRRKEFDIPTDQPGTGFQKAVWSEMCRIPYGGSSTYGEIAEAIGHPNAYRAVGTACGRNRIPIVIPCHRVLACSGIGGYAGGLDFKKMLLDLEAGNR